MPTIKRTVTIAAGDEAFPLTGSQYEYLPWPALIEAAILTDAGGDAIADFFSGSDVVLQSSPLDAKPVAEPITYPDDYQVQDVAGGGERLGLRIQNNLGVAGIVRVVVRITRLR